MDVQNILNEEIKGSIDFFLDFTNLDPASKGFGLTVDSTKDPEVASIASVGFALCAWIIARERGFLSQQEALEITINTLTTLCTRAAHYRGFFAHFLNMQNGERIKKCEFSTIDTAICLSGVITASAYFKDEQIAQLANQLLERVDWDFLVFEKDDRALFRMAYNPDKDGEYVTGQPGFIQQWDMAAEQKMLYLQAAGRLEPSLARRLYQGFRRDVQYFNGQPLIVNPGGNLFAYQFTEAWLDTFSYLDSDGVDWFNNTRLAALANRNFCLEHADEFPTYHEASWGLSAGDSPWGYDVFGSAPCLAQPRHNGTVSVYSALACLPFLPEVVIDMVKYLYEEHPKIWGPYGFFDAYNLAVYPPWYSKTIYGIDKGCSMLMIENYQNKLIWETFTNSPYIQNSLAVLGFKNRGGKINE